jgi:hypothetical protein
MPIGDILTQILSPFISGMGASRAPQAQQPVTLVGPETPMTPEEQMLIEQGVLSPSAQNPQGIAWGAGASPGYAGGTMNPSGADSGSGFGLTPLAQSLMAGYFSAIGTPKYQGLGSAISRGGLTALDTYGKAQELEAKSQLRPYELAKLRAEAELARGKADPEYRAALTAKNLGLAKKAEAEADVAREMAMATMAEKISQAWKNGTRPVVGPNGEEVFLPLKTPTPAGYRDMSIVLEEMKAKGKMSPGDRAREQKQAELDVDRSQLLSTLTDTFYVDPNTGAEYPRNTTTKGQAIDSGGIAVSAKDRDVLADIDEAQATINDMREAVKTTLTKEKDLPGGGRLQQYYKDILDKNYEPKKWAAFESAHARFFKPLKSLIFNERMTDEDRKLAYSAVPDWGNTQEAAEILLNKMEEILARKRARILPIGPGKTQASSAAGKLATEAEAKTLSPAKAAEFLKSAGGDAEKARAMAREQGYKF